jgi:hypothetical protein
MFPKGDVLLMWISSPSSCKYLKFGVDRIILFLLIVSKEARSSLPLDAGRCSIISNAKPYINRFLAMGKFDASAKIKSS